jgi:type II secretory ATPase GspE/PulE/Tfp pilus assembly ATPase PilB-like protein
MRDKLNQIIETFQNKNYIVETYYTDDVGFKLALGWYDQMLDYQQQLELKQDYRLEATGRKAIELITETIAHKADFSEVDLITELVRLAFQSGASDMHLQSENQWVSLRLRINGVLENIATISHGDFVAYLMKIKYIAWVKMNIAKTPQDGRFDFQVRADQKPRKIDARVSFMPWLRWESVVIRFLDGSKSIMTLSDIWFAPYHIPIVIARNLEKNSGIILVTGPTGSGKTTTLYSMLATLNNPDIKIVTLEDPVEYEIPGIQQSQINEEAWYTFAEGIRSVLRHDPDIILVWEIRDLDTANAAINAALTWHLVFSTLHTNSALEAIERLINLGVKPYLLAPAIQMIIGQRLVRGLTEANKDEHKPTSNTVIAKNGAKRNDEANQDETSSELNEELEYVRKFFPKYLNKESHVCELDVEEWYKGRLAVAEIFEPTDIERGLIQQGKLGIEINDIIRKTGYLTMRDDGLIKVWDGKTTMEELRRII